MDQAPPWKVWEPALARLESLYRLAKPGGGSSGHRRRLRSCHLIGS